MASNPTSSAAVVESSPSILPNNMSLRKLIPPKDCLKIRKRLQRQPRQPQQPGEGEGSQEEECCWSAVIARAKSHPHEAAESYFGLPTQCPSSSTDTAGKTAATSSSTSTSNYNYNNDKKCSMTTANYYCNNNNNDMHGILNYQPLHAMLKYNPPLKAVEAVLRAHPLAILNRTFEGTALQIAAENKVSNGLVLRLLLVAEMAMWRKERLARMDRVGRVLQKSQGQQEQTSSSSSSCRSSFVEDTSTIMVDTTITEMKDTSDAPQSKAISTKPTTKTTAKRTTISPTKSPTKSVTFATNTKTFQQQQQHQSHIQPTQPLQPTQSQPQPQSTNNYPSANNQTTTTTTMDHTTTLGPNPIAFITNHRVPVKTAAMLLKWYPIGAFQLITSGSNNNNDNDVGDYDMESGDGEAADEYDGENSSCISPLIEVVDDFARDHYYDDSRDEEEYEEEDDYYDSESDYEVPVEACSEDAARATADEAASLTAAALATRHQQQQRSHHRKEQRWEKFLHILYATDLVLQSTKQSGSSSGIDAMDAADTATNDTATTHADSQATAASRTEGSGAVDAASIATTANDATADIATGTATDEELQTAQKQQPRQQTSTTTTFHPVHAWIRCLTHNNSKNNNNNHSYNLGLQHIQPYGAFSILHEMGQRIPHEFTARDGNDGNRTAFQILAESKAQDCGLVCWEEVKDVVECLVDADYRSAFLPRKSDGRLIAHVALENGWPCKDLFSRKTSATCA